MSKEAYQMYKAMCLNLKSAVVPKPYKNFVPNKSNELKPELMPRKARRAWARYFNIPFVPVINYAGASDRRWEEWNIKQEASNESK